MDEERLARLQKKRDAIARLLPDIFQRTRGSSPPVFDSLLFVMAELYDPSEQVLVGLDQFFHPDRAPDRFIPFLARWMDLDRFLTPEGNFPTGMARMRDLILASVTLLQERGTRRGLIHFLEIATGVAGFQVEEDTEQPFHIHVYCPDARLLADESRKHLIHQIIEAEKPAYVTYRFSLRPEQATAGAK